MLQLVARRQRVEDAKLSGGEPSACICPPQAVGERTPFDEARGKPCTEGVACPQGVDGVHHERGLIDRRGLATARDRTLRSEGDDQRVRSAFEEGGGQSL